jgi:hypothetical protein
LKIILNRYLNSNESISLKHAENAANLLKLIVAFNSGITINANFVNTYDALFDGLNLTTKAIVAASLADECLKEYASQKARSEDSR